MSTRVLIDHRGLRHPEKAHRQDNPVARKPDWIRVKAPTHPVYHATRALMREHKLVTVCEEAACPNISECWSQRHATMMIMGEICTRACAFCNVRTGQPAALDAGEPGRVAHAVASLGLRHVVITSVDRDDLPDGGAAHFAAVIGAIRDAAPQTTIEILTPDFLRKPAALDVIVAARPDVFNHNLETVPRLYPTIRPGARYYQSLRLLDAVKQRDPAIFTKSGLMVGLGEQRLEILQVMDDLRIADVDFLTLGQYLQPSVKHAAVDRFVPPDEFADYAAMARSKGFLQVSATPLTRSSYHADADFASLRAARAPAGDIGGRLMPTHAERRLIAYTPEQLFDLVADVDRYPEFLPWCVGATVRSRTARELVADLTIGFGPFRESFTSRVELDRPHSAHVRYERGPFRYLNNKWTFTPHPNGCQVDFFVEFEFRSRLLQAAIGAVFNEAVRLMVRAFLRRARAVYGPPGVGAEPVKA